jgi:hypothetical protein
MVDTFNKSYRNILVLGGLLNTMAILVFSKCFTNEVHSLSSFGDVQLWTYDVDALGIIDVCNGIAL